MKKILVLIVLLCTLVVNAQTYLINFEGTGASTIVSSIKVENLTKAISVTLSGNQQLRLTGATGIDLLERSHESTLKVYSYWETGKTLIQFHPSEAGNASVSVFDMYGKCIITTQYYVDNKLQQFILSGIAQGTYLVSVRGNTYHYSGKMLSYGQSSDAINIENMNTDSNVSVQKVPENVSNQLSDIVDMDYSTGDLLKFTCTSGNFSTVLTDVPTQNKTISIEFAACTDGDNNNYRVVRIGTQLWMAENLRTTHKSNGSLIPSGVYDYNNTPSNASIYGKLYTWSAMMAGEASSNNSPSGVAGICPLGWHIPSNAEWTTMINLLGGASLAGGKLKDAGLNLWSSPNTGATNSSGFSGLPGGFAGETLNFGNLGAKGFYWSSTEYFANNGWAVTLVNNTKALTLSSLFKTFGFSCRCVKD